MYLRIVLAHDYRLMETMDIDSHNNIGKHSGAGGHTVIPRTMRRYFFSTISLFIGPSTPSNSSFSVLPTL